MNGRINAIFHWIIGHFHDMFQLGLAQCWPRKNWKIDSICPAHRKRCKPVDVAFLSLYADLIAKLVIVFIDKARPLFCLTA